MVWQQVHEGQQIAIEAARVGVAAGRYRRCSAIREVGRGPDTNYRHAASHRPRHRPRRPRAREPVHGEPTALATGMCFSDEPGIYLPGKFGIRLEDGFTWGPRTTVL